MTRLGQFHSERGGGQNVFPGSEIPAGDGGARVFFRLPVLSGRSTRPRLRTRPGTTGKSHLRDRLGRDNEGRNARMQMRSKWKLGRNSRCFIATLIRRNSYTIPIAGESSFHLLSRLIDRNAVQPSTFAGYRVIRRILDIATDYRNSGISIGRSRVSMFSEPSQSFQYFMICNFTVCEFSQFSRT
mgnify:CR=1 FL=1